MIFAGNEWEWTLEHAVSNSGYPCAYRGGDYAGAGSKYPASYRGNNSIGDSYSTIGFRSTFYVD